MSEELTEETATETEAPSAGIGGGIAPESAAESLDFGSEDNYQQFVSSLPEDLRDKNLFKETKSFQSLAEQAINAQSALGKKRLAVPQEDWTDTDYQDFYSKLRPETMDGYVSAEKHSIQLEGQDIKEMQFPEEIQNQLKEVAHNIGLTPKQFNALESEWATRQVMSESTLDAQIQESVQTQTNELRSEWGADYAINHKSANETFDAFAQQIPELRQLMEWSPVVGNHPAVLKLFHSLAPMVGDAGMPTAGGGSSFGQDTVAGIKSQIDQFDQENSELMFMPENKLATLTPSDKARRESFLKQRTAMYQKLYSGS